jgi:hypothetical protein
MWYCQQYHNPLLIEQWMKVAEPPSAVLTAETGERDSLPRRRAAELLFFPVQTEPAPAAWPQEHQRMLAPLVGR